MPIANREDAVEVESRIGRIFAASPPERAGELRALFVEVLDFDSATGDVRLDAAPSNVALPASAQRVAELDGVHVLYVALDTVETDRVRKGDVAAAARLIADQLGDDLLMVFTNTSSSQLHLVHPSFEGSQPTLRRLIVERDLPRRTAVQQVSNIYWYRRETGSIRSALDKAFDVEAVTDAFFDEYERVFDLAMARVEGFGTDEQEQEKSDSSYRRYSTASCSSISCRGRDGSPSGEITTISTPSGAITKPLTGRTRTSTSTG